MSENAEDSGAAPVDGRNWTSFTTKREFTWIAELGLWVAKYTTTNAEYRAFRADHDSAEFDGHSLNEDNQPAVMVSYDDCMAYCEWLTKEELVAGMPSGHFFRLPSHDEWTTFARCGDGREYPWGNEWPPTYGNFADEAAKRAFPDWEVFEGIDTGHPVACPVEASGENDWGLCGVGGNVYEWTFQAGGTACELRGGSWSTNQQEYLKTMNRYQREPGSKLVNFGFRLVLLH
jgi:formylglycine-generating enzyme required for sulfatase activity